MDFNEFLHVIEADSGEKPALCIQVGEGLHLALPRKPKKKVISSFSEWVRCFLVYASTLCAYQPLRGPDVLAYLHVIASAHEEFHFLRGLKAWIRFSRTRTEILWARPV